MTGKQGVRVARSRWAASACSAARTEPGRKLTVIRPAERRRRRDRGGDGRGRGGRYAPRTFRRRHNVMYVFLIVPLRYCYCFRRRRPCARFVSDGRRQTFFFGGGSGARGPEKKRLLLTRCDADARGRQAPFRFSSSQTQNNKSRVLHDPRVTVFPFHPRIVS